MEVGEKGPVHVHCGASEGSKRRRKECRGVGRMGSGFWGLPSQSWRGGGGGEVNADGARPAKSLEEWKLRGRS